MARSRSRSEPGRISSEPSDTSGPAHSDTSRPDNGVSLFRLAMERSAIGMCLVAPEGTFRAVNPALCEILGRSADDLLSSTWQEITHPDDLEIDLALVDEVATGKRDHYRLLKRYVHSDGSVIWGDLSVGVVREPGGAVRFFVVQIVDMTELVTARRAREDLDARYRLLAEHTADIVCETDADGVLTWVSPSAEAVLGWRPAEVVGMAALDLIDPADRELAARREADLYAGLDAPDSELRVRSATGEVRWMTLHGETIRDGAGNVTAAVVGLRDCQAEVVLRRALRMQSAGHSILARAGSELELLADMCQAAVDEAGYLLAWYARRVNDADQHVAFVAHSREHADYLTEIRLSWGDGPLGQGPTGRALRTGTTCIVSDLATDTAFAPWAQAAVGRGFRSSISVPVFVNGVLDGTFSVYAPEPHAFDEHAVAVLEDFAGQVGYGVAKLRDAQALIESVRRSQLLQSVVEQAAEAIVITDPSTAIIYANPAAVRSSGYSLAEMRGHNPRIFQSGVHPRSYYEALWSRLVGGEPWSGVLVNRRKNGEVYEESSTIAPVYGTDGALVAYVAVKRDVTHERSLEAALTRTRADHQALAEVMDRIHPGESLEETAQGFCDAACRLDGVDGAAVLVLQQDDALLTAATAGTGPTPFVAGEPLAVDPRSDWHQRVKRGEVWHIDLVHAPDSETSRLAAAALAHGITAAVVFPISWDEALAGLGVLYSRAPDGTARLEALGTIIDEISAFATSLLGHQLVNRREREDAFARYRSYLDEQRYHCVYQPVVNLTTAETIGYEALTRFDDGTDPETAFADAHAVGLGTELEIACLRKALDDAPRLPPGAWVSINLSPTVLLDGSAVPHLVRHDRQVVVEITEHSAIQDYPRLRRAIAALPGVWLSVDDAGAGYASLRHILELRPRIVKLDVALVRDIDTDPARQGLAAGLTHFAAQTDTMLVAEGVETPEEAEMLLGLGIGHAQGFLYGRPEPVR